MNKVLSIGGTIIGVSLLIRVLLGAGTAYGDVSDPPVISEVMWMGTDLSTADEWVEIALPQAANPVQIDGWGLFALKGTGETLLVRFPSHSLQPGEFIVVGNFAADQSRLKTNPLITSSTLSLPNTKLLLRLRDAQGTLVDEVDDGVGDPFSGSNAAPKASMERLDLLLPGNVKTNWTNATISLGFDEGSSLLGTPGYAREGVVPPSINSSSSEVSSSVSSFSIVSSAIPSSSMSSEIISSSFVSSTMFSSTENIEQISSSSISTEAYSSIKSSTSSITKKPEYIRVSEVLANPLGVDDGEWVEIENTGDTVQDITGMKIRVGTARFTIPGEQVSPLEPSQVLLLPKAVTGISLPNTGGEVFLEWQGEIIDSFLYRETREGISEGKVGQIVQLFCSPTAGNVNQVIEPDPFISIQSGSQSGVGSVTLNTEVKLRSGVLFGAVCEIDFGDGSFSPSCNPPSHSYKEPGEYVFVLKFMDYCSTTVERSLDITVIEKPLANLQNQSSTNQSRSASSSASVLFHDRSAKVVVTAALPNPVGEDKTAGEWVELLNTGTTVANVTGWKLRDASGDELVLENMEIPVGSIKKIEKLGISLGNTDEEIILITSWDEEMSSLKWSKAGDGQVIRATSDIGTRVVTFLDAIDGDTIHVKLVPGSKEIFPGQKIDKVFSVRLLGIDAPEVADNRHDKEPYSDESKKELSDLLKAKKIELQFDSELQDTYGRILAYVHVSGVDVAEELLRDGLVRLYDNFPFVRLKEYQVAEDDAKRNGKGIWTDEVISKVMEEADETAAIEYKDYWLELGLSEIYPSPTDGKEWVEIFNRSTEVASLLGFSIDDAVGTGSKPWKIDENMLIPAGGYILLPSELTHLQLNNGGDSVTLLAPDGSVIETMQYPSVKTNQSVVRNLDDSWCISTTATPALPNICTLPAGKTTKKSTTKKSTAAPRTGVKTSYKNVVAGDSSEEEDQLIEESGATLSSFYQSLAAQAVFAEESDGEIGVSEAKNEENFSFYLFLPLCFLSFWVGFFVGYRKPSKNA